MGFTCLVKEGDPPNRRATPPPAHVLPSSIVGTCNTHKPRRVVRHMHMNRIFIHI
jgi:hypothetical protein